MFKVKLNDSQQAIVDLEKCHRKLCAEDSEKAMSLRRWFISHGSLTPSQRDLAAALIARTKRKSQIEHEIGRAAGKYFLYAISDGEFVKLGFSTDPSARRKELQTGQPRRLKEVWRYFIGYDRQEVVAAEKALHRLCKKHKAKAMGEWFHAGCMGLVKGYAHADKRKKEKQRNKDAMAARAAEKAAEQQEGDTI